MRKILEFVVMAHVLMPLPALDFDPTEAGVSWAVLTGRGHRVSFATPEGLAGRGDEIMLTGEGLDPWGFAPGIRRARLIGLMLRADVNGREAYRAMAASPAFQAPLRWDEVAGEAFDGLLLAGGHRARGMRPYLESSVLQALVAGFFGRGAPVGAICHGVLLAARSVKADGRSVLFGRKTTALTWRLERAADSLARVGRFWDGGYYRTYPDPPGRPGYMSVQQEVTRALASPADFIDVDSADPDYRRKALGLARDSLSDARPAFFVRDAAYVSARWPGDAHGFAQAFGQVLEGK
jgi:putative intracellular protease/amidase